ncbi:MAG TPA: hypothetical protein VK476_02885, partial [Flavobacterium sp.]|nr:hypothetical protein [Flavobacterium sp.]
YKTEAQIKFSIGNWIGTPGLVNYIPIHQSRGPLTEKLQARLVDGVSNVTATLCANLVTDLIGSRKRR